MIEIKDKKEFLVEERDIGQRVDKMLASRFPEYSRQYFRRLIDRGFVKLDGKPIKASEKLKSGRKIRVVFPAPVELDLKPLNIALDVVYEDKNILVINKPAGMVVHPGAGESHLSDSLVNAVLAHAKDSLSGIGGVMRPGIVHRLDKDTSGLLVIAKNDKAHNDLAVQFKEHDVEKTYYALVSGHLVPEKGSIEAPIGRDPRDRKRMAVVSEEKGKMAITRYKVLKYLNGSSYLEINLITGRTHQIRVHFASIGHPLVGDPIYGRDGVNKKFVQEYGFHRLFLHAGVLKLRLPDKKSCTFKADLPEELKQLLKDMSGMQKE
jgi:23S rRNA pseudouridine1911/1915/1917 synthase